MGWLTEDGPAPWLAEFGLVECPAPGYPAGTRGNVGGADATLWFGDWMTPGGKTTLDAGRSLDKPFMLVHQGITKSRALARECHAASAAVDEAIFDFSRCVFR